MPRDDSASRPGQEPARDEPQEPAVRKPRWQTWQSHVEEQILDAQRRGEFANLRGQGKPLNLDADTSDPNWLTNRSLRGAGFLPPALDMGHEIDEARAAAAQPLQRIRRRREYLQERAGLDEDDRARFNAARLKAIADHRAALKSINDRILTLNLTAPAPLHRRPIVVDREIGEFERDCPAL